MVLVKSAEGRWKGGICVLRWEHRVDKVLGFFSSRPNWDSPTPSPLPPFSSGGGVHARLREGVEGPNSDEGTDALGIYVLCGWE